jgi:hypothetical protein
MTVRNKAYVKLQVVSMARFLVFPPMYSTFSPTCVTDDFKFYFLANLLNFSGEKGEKKE